MFFQNYNSERAFHLQTMELENETNLTERVIKKKFRAFAQICHPDRASSEEELRGFTEKFKRINASKEW